jgi:hypothetical protein
MSRQALILRRRQTQHSGSEPAIAVSAPQTEHLVVFFRRSVEIDCFACSRISGAMIGSGFGCALRLICFPVLFHYARNPAPEQPPKCKGVLSSFRNLYYYSNIQGSPAASAPLAGGHPRVFPLQIDIRRNGMRTDRAMDLALSVVFNECFHINGLTSSDELSPAKVVPKFVKIFDLSSPLRLSVPFIGCHSDTFVSSSRTPDGATLKI